MARGLADDVKFSFQRIGDGNACAAADEDLADGGLDPLHRVAQSRVFARHVAPAEEHLAFVLDCALDLVLAREARSRLLGQEHHSDAVLANGWQEHVLQRHFLAKKLVRDLHKDARTVTREGIGPHRTAVGKIFEDRQALLDNRVAFDALDVRHKTDAAGVVFVGRVVQALAIGGMRGRVSVCHVKPLDRTGPGRQLFAAPHKKTGELTNIPPEACGFKGLG